MKRTWIIALVLLVSFVMLGVGYAWWDETVAITSIASTGELTVEFVGCDDMVYVVSPPYFDYNDERTELDSCWTTPFTLEDDNHTLLAKFHNVFPGLFYSIPFKMANKGTIPAVFRECTIECDIIDSTLNGEDENALLDQLGTNLKVSNLAIQKYTSSGIRVGSLIHIINGYSISLDQLAQCMNTNAELSQLRLEPGEYIQALSAVGGNIRFKFSEDFDNSFENKRFTVKIHMKWVQHNAID